MTAPTPMPCTRDDPRCARLLERLAQARERMRAQGIGLLDGRPVVNYFTNTDVRKSWGRAK